MLSHVRKFGLHLVLANQSIAQLSKSLQTALSNAQTIVAFRISRADAEALARVLGRVDSLEIKREAQTPTQHPIFSPLLEQWEAFVQFLTTQAVRQFTVKTADDRLAVIWSEITSNAKYDPEKLEHAIQMSLKRHGSALSSSVLQPTDHEQPLAFFSTK
jgi:hypothetical protein